jgi:hypothetical protein
MIAGTTKKPEQDQRSPAEASALARDVMKRMLAMPPTPHVTKQMKKKSRGRKSR